MLQKNVVYEFQILLNSRLNSGFFVQGGVSFQGVQEDHFFKKDDIILNKESDRFV